MPPEGISNAPLLDTGHGQRQPFVVGHLVKVEYDLRWVDALRPGEHVPRARPALGIAEQENRFPLCSNELPTYPIVLGRRLPLRSGLAARRSNLSLPIR